mgnify:CR=1 FL=1
MKKYLFSLILLFVSYLGFSQKGLSYQAVILDPEKIEIPGQDISGQPLVNGDVWLKFSIYNGTTLQFEEVQKTKSDSYGLVNLLIGSVSSASFNSLVWDSSQKSLQVYVSFNQGVSYTKISDQKLNYNPYAFFAETAGKLGGVLSIENGGTSATTAVDARAKLGLDQVNNTSDAAKPVSAATQVALNLKANTANMALELALKANTADVTTALAAKADTGTIKAYVDSKLASGNYTSSQNSTATITDADASTKGKIQLAGDLGGTAASPTVPGLAWKANTVDVNNSLALKANISDMSSALMLKANAADVITSLGLKEDTSNKSAATGLGNSDQLYPTQKAVKTYVDAQVAAATIADADANTKGKIQLAGDLGGTAVSPTVPGLAWKANTVDVNNSLALKANISDMSSALMLKANAADVITSLGLKEDTSNKSAATGLGNSDQLYPTQKAVKTYVDAQVAAATIADADANTKGKIQLAGDLGGTAAVPTVPGLALKVNSSSLSSVATSGDYNDLSNKPSIPTAYTLPKATGSVLGGIKVGANLSIDANGILSGPSSYSLPTASSSELGGVKVGTGLTISNGVLNATASGVPYIGATQAVDLGTFDLKVNGITVGRGNNGLEVNVGIGKNVLLNTISGFQGNYLTAIGFEALKNDTWGYFNTAIGSSALFSNTYGIANTAIGSNSLYNNIGANFNTAVGTDALKANTDGISNTAIGKSTGNVNTTGNQNTAIGAEANFGASNLINATAIGYNAIVTASNSVRLGNTAVSNVKTNGTITAGTVTYPNAHNSIAGQVLTTDASGVAFWALSSARSWTDQPAVSANQTTFTLTYAPPATNKIWMFINGVRTNNTAYSVSGTTVTYVPSSNGGYVISASDRIQFDYTY